MILRNCGMIVVEAYKSVERLCGMRMVRVGNSGKRGDAWWNEEFALSSFTGA